MSNIPERAGQAAGPGTRGVIDNFRTPSARSTISTETPGNPTNAPINIEDVFGSLPDPTARSQAGGPSKAELLALATNRKIS